MRKTLLFLTIFFLSFSKGYSQCSPDFLYTSLGLPGVFPPAIQIPNLPLPLGISDGTVGVNYSQTLTMIVPQDTTLDIGFLLPSAAVAAMNLAGISTTMTVDINHVSFDVQGLPNVVSYQCDISSCQYPSNSDGCIQLSGTPTIAGTFSVPVNMTVNIQLPSINIPLYGTVGGMGQDIPAFAAQTYDLLINQSTFLEGSYNTTRIYPNPTNSICNIEFNSSKKIRVFNSIGELIYYSNDFLDRFVFSGSYFGKGIFILESFDKDSYEQHKLIIN